MSWLVFRTKLRPGNTDLMMDKFEHLEDALDFVQEGGGSIVKAENLVVEDDEPTQLPQPRETRRIK